MSTYDKLIKQATKPKPGAPKPKYIDPIIASSFSQDGSLQDICRALSGRLADSSSLVVFRSLIVVHTLIRNGGVDNVLSHLASSQGSLRLRNVVQGGNWQGYDAPRMLSPYAAYLEERIKAYRELRHDVMRASDVARTRGGDRSEGAESGLRLRRLTVEKGLLREVSVCQKVCSRLMDLFFSYFSDNVHDELSLTAFRMSLKDLLAVYAAINEGVINVLEHYFEMSKVDATNALEIYKRFCAHTEKIVAFLASARKVSHSLNVPIPNLRHAPVSLAGALKEYLDDPNFEKNRQEYKDNKRVADGKGPSKSKANSAPAKKDEVPASSSKKSITIQEPSAEEKTKPVKPPTSNQALQDFFESIETDQMSMFGPGAQQQGFVMPQATGFQPQMQMMAPQMTGYNPFFGSSGFMQPQQTGFMQPQMTGFAPGGFLSPQMTAANPFRQSVMMQPTGMSNGFGQDLSGLQQTGMPSQQQHSQPQQTSSANAFTSTFGAQAGSTNLSNNGSAFGNPTQSQSPPPSSSAQGDLSSNEPARSSSVPLPKALTAQKTGSRNPFAPPPGSTPPPKSPPSAKGPTLFELAFGGAGSTQGPSTGGGGNYGLGADAWNGSTQQQQQSSQSGLLPQKTGLIGSVASEFVGGNPTLNGTSKDGLLATPAETALPSSAGQGSTSAGLSSGIAGLSIGGSTPSGTASPAGLQPQPTGFGGSAVQPFKPESSFGMSMAAMPTGLQSSAPVAPNMTGNPFANFGASTGTVTSNPASSSNAPSSSLASQPTGYGSSLFGGAAGRATSPSVGGAPPQQTQQTGYGSSLFGSGAPTNSGLSTQPTGQGPPHFNLNNAKGVANGLAPQPTGFGGSNVKPFQPSSAFGSAVFSNLGQQPQQQQQQQQQQQPSANVTAGSLF